MADNQPCSYLAAAFVMASHGLLPADPTKAKNWANLKPSLWQDINLYYDAPKWDGVDTVAELSGKTKLTAPTKTNTWYFVQRWRPDKSSGHAYIVMLLDNGFYRVVQSSRALGYRDTIEKDFVPSKYEVWVVEIN